MDGSSLAQQSSNQDPNSQQLQHNQQCHGTSSATSLPTSRVGQVQLASGLPNGQGLRVPGSFIQDPVALPQMQKKPRLDINQEDILQQLLQRRDPLHIQDPSPQLQALVQQQRLRRLMQYLYHQRQRPTDNSIAYWRRFVAEYYSPQAKKRWCFSLYENIGHHSLDLFPQSTMVKGSENNNAWDFCPTSDLFVSTTIDLIRTTNRRHGMQVRLQKLTP
ncbi:hypothetical protein BC332_08062 [Capsicum chinense]|nr:hypothetical protein BC332_08062 [Capsicum chinense]